MFLFIFILLYFIYFIFYILYFLFIFIFIYLFYLFILLLLGCGFCKLFDQILKKVFDYEDSFSQKFQLFHYDMTWQNVPKQLRNKLESELNIPSLIAFSQGGSHIYRGKLNENGIKEWFSGFNIEDNSQEIQDNENIIS